MGNIGGRKQGRGGQRVSGEVTARSTGAQDSWPPIDGSSDNSRNLAEEAAKRTEAREREEKRERQRKQLERKKREKEEAVQKAKEAREPHGEEELERENGPSTHGSKPPRPTPPMVVQPVQKTPQQVEREEDSDSCCCCVRRRALRDQEVRFRPDS